MAKIHQTAIVHPEAKVDASCEIGPYCIIGPKAEIGANNKFHGHVVVENRVKIGSNNEFFPFSVIGGAPQDLKYKGEDTLLQIGDRNTIRECVTLNIGTDGGGGQTKVGNECLIMAYVHLGHDTIVEDNVILGNSCQIAGHVNIGEWAILGGQTAVAQFIRIGAHTYIGGASGADRDVPPYTLGRGISSDYEIWGLNLVGLKRRGMSTDVIHALQEMNKMYFQDKTDEKEAALQKIDATLGHIPEVKHFIDFARASKKGMYR